MKHIVVKIDTTTTNYDDCGVFTKNVIAEEIANLMGINKDDIEIEIEEEQI